MQHLTVENVMIQRSNRFQVLTLADSEKLIHMIQGSVITSETFSFLLSKWPMWATSIHQKVIIAQSINLNMNYCTLLS